MAGCGKKDKISSAIYGKLQGMDMIKVLKGNYITFILILLICVFSNVKYFIDEKSVYHINSVTASPFLYIKLQIDNFRNLSFYPQYWTNLINTGIPIHSGLAVYNPLLLFLVFFNKLGHVMIFYDILLKFISGVGVFFLLKKYKFSWFASTCCSLIYPLNPFGAAFGQDPQFVSVVYILPWIYIFIELIIENLNRKISALIYSLILALILSVCYLVSNIQFYTFLFCFGVVSFALIRIYVMFTNNKYEGYKKADRKSRVLTFIFFIGVAFAVHLLLILFEIIPTLNIIKFGNRAEEILSFSNNIRFVIYLSILVFFAILFRRLLSSKNLFISYFCSLFIIFVLLFNVDYNLLEMKTIKNLIICNYFQKVDEASFHFGNQIFRYFYTFLQLILTIIVLLRPKTLKDKKFILFNISLSYLFLEFLGHYHLTRGIQSIYPRYFFRFSFLPFIGMMIGFAWALDLLRSVIPIKKGIYTILSFFIFIIFVGENYYVYLNRALFTNGLSYIDRDGLEYDFLKKIRPTERIIDAYNDDHNNWMINNRPRLYPKWLLPTLFGANTLSRVGVNIIPKENAEYNKVAMPLPSVIPGHDGLFGVDEKKPLNPLLNLAGVKYIFTLKQPDKDNDLKLIAKGEYFIYENLSVLPRFMLLPEVELVDNDILSVLKLQTNQELLKKAFVNSNEKIVIHNSGKNDISLMSDTEFVSNLGSLKLSKYENERVKIDCKILEESFFMITDTFYNGWKAYIGDKEQKIIRSDYIYRGLKLLPGEYSLIMKYEPVANRYALYISFITFLIITSVLIWGFAIRIKWEKGI